MDYRNAMVSGYVGYWERDVTLEYRDRILYSSEDLGLNRGPKSGFPHML
jgi:hypothetical protein